MRNGDENVEQRREKGRQKIALQKYMTDPDLGKTQLVTRSPTVVLALATSLDDSAYTCSGPHLQHLRRATQPTTDLGRTG